jgi:hypothetical protein
VCVGVCAAAYVQSPYFGGERACRLADDSHFDPSELLCGGCAPHSADAVCAKHGTDYIEFKCRFCCSIAVRTQRAGHRARMGVRRRHPVVL